jgi:DNA-binding GntR family transcriptional regulator
MLPARTNHPLTNSGPSRPRLVDTLVEELRRRIISGDLQPGTRLPQNDLSESLGVSRTPLREALRVLERDGLIKSGSRSGTVEVVDPDPVALLEVFQLRCALDGLAGALCAERGLSASQLERLTAKTQQMEDMSVPRDTDGYIESHAGFHAFLYEASGNRRLQDFGSMLLHINGQKRMMRFVLSHAPHRIAEIVQAASELVTDVNQDHRRLLAAIAEQRIQDARAISERHAERSVAWVRRFSLPA